MPEPDPKPSTTLPTVFEAVFQAECEEIRQRRGTIPGALPRDLKGLALSGGGIRSATFCLGVLQHLSRTGELKRFDYLSTVSGGGFVGGWWSAWLSRPARVSPGSGGTRQVFPPEEKIEPDRTRWSLPVSTDFASRSEAPDQPEGSKSAGVDPVHHLRLFANYLTPRKGALSGDTWRAITVITRNLFLTLLMLLPILGAAILLAQLYFVADAKLAVPFVCAVRPDGLLAEPSQIAAQGSDSTPGMTACRTFLRNTSQPSSREEATAQYSREVEVRAARYLVPIFVLLGWTLVAVAIWMWFSTGKVLVALGASAGVGAVLWLLSLQISPGARSLLENELGSDQWFMPALIIGSTGVVLYALYLLGSEWLKGRQAVRAGTSALQGDVLTNRLTKLQSALLVVLTVVGVVLLFGGFGHELVRYLFAESRGGWINRSVNRAGGWVVVLITLGGTIFTALKAAPTGGADHRSQAPGRLSRLVFTVTPFLVLLLLMLALATTTHSLLGTLRVTPPDQVPPLYLALLAGVTICFAFAIYEFWTDADEHRTLRHTITLVALAGGVLGLFFIPAFTFSRASAAAIVGFTLGLVLVAWTFPRLLHQNATDGPLTAPKDTRPKPTLRLLGRILLLLAVPSISAYALGRIRISASAMGHGHPVVARFALAGMLLVAVFSLLALIFRVLHSRVLSLLTLGLALLSVLYLEQFLRYDAAQVLFPTAVVALIGVALSGVVGLGWMVDPNYLSLHTFYRARLVRAYLGASNDDRRGAEITEAVDGDDLPIHQLANCDRGGPYHIVNTTLNLVAGRDLATSQRSASCFTLSKNYCGSLRTGYRDSRYYMDGRLTLGTALAVSGAAASPNMGAKTSSAALAMLLALLNVRLGFWAPTPDKPRWTSPRSRLWPFYLLREFLSQTNDLSSYCYLTDGGHFDNTGLYSLVQRGCLDIMLVDCGADPDHCFADLGDAIRRCRIDFGTTIDLSVDTFRNVKDGLSSNHFVIGSIIYHPEHTRRLGWPDLPDPAARTGRIVWIKPSLVKGDPADVMQYSFENDNFPQQSTGDQWFDEAQFESYRRLGMACAAGTLAGLEARRSGAQAAQT